MAQCQRCGRKGLLIRLNKDGFCSVCQEEIKQYLIKQQEAQIRKEAERELMESNPHFAKVTKELEHQDKLLQDVLKAREEYTEDGDITKAIDALEAAIIKENPPLLNAQGHTLFLVDLYKKSGQNDKAWGLLNSCLLDSAKYNGKARLPKHKIRPEMAKLLKSEKKYSQAIEMYLLHYVENKPRNDYEEEKMRKDVATYTKKLKWDDDVADDIISMLEKTIASKQNPTEAKKELIEQYRTYIKENNLE